MRISKSEILAGLLSKSGLLHVLEIAAQRPCILVLNYHRIGTPAGNRFDDKTFSANEQEFRTQLEYISGKFDLMTLEECVQSADRKFPLTKPSVMITFDDGYKDSYDLALPILREMGIPATFFVSTDYISRRRLPWWDWIAYLIKKASGTAIKMDYPTSLNFDFSETGRSGVIQELLVIYKRHPNLDTERFLTHLEERCGFKGDCNAIIGDLFMSWDEVVELTKNGMSVGSHTCSHPLLSKLTETEQRQELVSSKNEIESHLNQECSSLAYPVGSPPPPSGAFSELTKRIAKEVGYRIAFSFYGGINRTAHADPFDIYRIGVNYLDSLSLFKARTMLLASRGIFKF
ncbi:MAG: polysaccharide deacetylase family protein [Nitrospira sp.]|nr:polysaccharide deacetylase family protein [Nitrospira sp.]